MKIQLIIPTIIFSLISLTGLSQDSIFIYDIASQSLIQKIMPAYNVNTVSDSTNPSFGIHGITNMPSSPPLNTYPSTNISLKQKASDFYTAFNFPFSAVSLIRYGFNITAAVIGKRALLVYKYDVRQPNSHWRNLADANPFYENGTIQYGWNKLTPVRYYGLNSFDLPFNGIFAVVEVAENIGDDAGYFGLAFDTTANAYDSLLLYNISYPKKDPSFPIYPDSTNGDTLYMKYGRVDYLNANSFAAYYGANGEYDSPFFDANFHVRGIRWSAQENNFLTRKEFYFLKYVVDSLATAVNEINNNGLFTIFSNPATDHLTLELPPINSITQIKIFNMLGDLTYSRAITSEKTTIDISTLISGAYIVQVEIKNAISRQKLIKQ